MLPQAREQKLHGGMQFSGTRAGLGKNVEPVVLNDQQCRNGLDVEATGQLPLGFGLRQCTTKCALQPGASLIATQQSISILGAAFEDRVGHQAGTPRPGSGEGLDTRLEECANRVEAGIRSVELRQHSLGHIATIPLERLEEEALLVAEGVVE